jgi:hypothetical protein
MSCDGVENFEIAARKEREGRELSYQRVGHFVLFQAPAGADPNV